MVPTVVERLGVNTVAYAELEHVGTVSALLPGASEVAPEVPATLSFVAADCHLFDAEGTALPRRVDSAMPIPDAATA